MSWALGFKIVLAKEIQNNFQIPSSAFKTVLFPSIDRLYLLVPV